MWNLDISAYSWLCLYMLLIQLITSQVQTDLIRTGPNGVCQKILGQDEETALLHVRWDTPGLTTNLFILKGVERIVVAYGIPGSGCCYKQREYTYCCVIQNYYPRCTIRCMDYKLWFGIFRMRCCISRTLCPPPTTGQTVDRSLLFCEWFRFVEMVPCCTFEKGFSKFV